MLQNSGPCETWKWPSWGPLGRVSQLRSFATWISPIEGDGIFDFRLPKSDGVVKLTARDRARRQLDSRRCLKSAAHLVCSPPRSRSDVSTMPRSAGHLKSPPPRAGGGRQRQQAGGVLVARRTFGAAEKTLSRPCGPTSPCEGEVTEDLHAAR